MASPVQAAQANQILAMLAGGPGGPTGASAGPGGPQPPSPQSAALQGATQQLDGANPQGLATTLRQINDALAQVYLTAAMRIPDMAEDVSRARAALERAIRKAQQAAQVVQQVNPIANSAGIGPQSTGAAPDIGAMLQAGGGAGI